MNRGDYNHHGERWQAPVSRRGFLLRAAQDLLPFLGSPMPFIPLAAGKETSGKRWYEIVQDMKSPELWHVNLFGARELGDLNHGLLLEHKLFGSNDLALMLDEIAYPLRIQFRNGNTSSIGM